MLDINMIDDRKRLLEKMTLADEDGSLPLPDFNHEGLLPLSLSNTNGIIARQSPYGCSLTTFRERFGFTDQREKLIDGLERFRSDLTSEGVHIAFQWVSGSFVERDAEPKDLDLVTFYMPPCVVRTPAEMKIFALSKPHLFIKKTCKDRYGCEPNYVLLANNPLALVRATTHWTMLLSYRRDGLPRGFVALGGVANT